MVAAEFDQVRADGRDDPVAENGDNFREAFSCAFEDLDAFLLLELFTFKIFFDTVLDAVEGGR